MRALQRIPTSDVVHLFQPFLPGAIPWLVGRLRARRPLIVYDWDDLWWNSWEQQLFLEEKTTMPWRKRLAIVQRNWMEKYLPAWSDLVTTCSQPLARRASERGAALVQVVPNGADDRDCFDEGNIRKRFGLRDDAFYLGFAGWTLMHVEWCLELLRRVRGWLPTARLAFCGADPRTLGLSDLLLSEACDFLGVLSPGDCAAFCRAADLLLLPLLDNDINQARFPMKFAEYAASGTPFLCSAVGECLIWADRVPSVRLAPPSEDGWLEAGEACVRAIEASTMNAKDNQNTRCRELLWNEVVGVLEEAYQRGCELRRK